MQTRGRAGLYLESTSDEHYGVLPGEDRRVHEVMSRHVVTIEPSASLRQAAAAMRDHGVSAVVVCREGRLHGLVTAQDLVVHGTAAGVAPEAMTVDALIGRHPAAACREDMIVADAKHLMAEHGRQSLPVLNAGGDVVGILSLMDVAAAVMPGVAAAWLSHMKQRRAGQH
jgi:CBS domain-containing protein